MSALVLAAGPAVTVAQLTAISGQINGTAASLVIEATSRRTTLGPIATCGRLRSRALARVASPVAVEPPARPRPIAVAAVAITRTATVVIVDRRRTATRAAGRRCDGAAEPPMRWVRSPGKPPPRRGPRALAESLPPASKRPRQLPRRGSRSARPGRPFTGAPISLDFQGADLRAVLRTFAEVSGLNMVIDPAVSGTVDVALRDVPWDQALDIILRANKLGYAVDGTIVRIAPLTVLAEEEAQRRKLTDDRRWPANCVC